MEIFNFRQLTPRIATAGQPTAAQLAAVAAAGYEVVINLALHTGDYALPDERGVVEGLGLRYEHIPVVWEQPTLADFDAFCAVMAQHAARRVFIHCVANFRASAFMFLYRVLVLGWPVADAAPDMAALWEPYDAWPAFIATALQRSAA